MSSIFQNIDFDKEAPLIDFKDGVLLLYGLCIPTNPQASLTPIFELISKYLNQDLDLILIMKFKAVNSSSSKMFIDLIIILNDFRKKDSISNSKRNIEIIWCSFKQDIDIEELGEYYQLCNETLSKQGKYKQIKFNLKKVNYE
jgi:hypothetical protein